MYEKFAAIYDLIYSFKDYKKEVKIIKKLISKHKKSDGNQLLDVACGTGKHILYLKEDFECTGVDISDGMLNIAKKTIKGAQFIKSDMIELNLQTKFDVILCLFSSIGYVKTYENLQRTIQNFYDHLKLGGVLIIEPWFTRSVYMEGTPHITTYEGENLNIARANIAKIENDLSVMNMHYLIAKKDADDVVYYTEKHELGFFEIDKTLEIMKEVGIEPEFLENGLMKDRGLYIGIKS